MYVDVIIYQADSVESRGENASYWYTLYLSLCLLFISSGVIGLVYLFLDYTQCKLGMFFVVLTVILGVLQLVLSVLNVVNKGLLTPCIIFAYSVFMCW